MPPRKFSRAFWMFLLSVVCGLSLRGDVLPSAVAPDALQALGSLEQQFPLCHGEAHEIGRELFRRTKDLHEALSLCGHRCTNGCMHGVLTEAIGQGDPASIQRLMEACQGSEQGIEHKRGNCAHAVGHGLLATTGRDLDRALFLCAGLFDDALEYYCATGVFMQYADDSSDGATSPTAARGDGHQERSGNHRLQTNPDLGEFPCHATAFPAACYRYRLEKLATVLSPEQLLNECLQLRGRGRLGCFHGFGAIYYRTVAERPSSLTVVCAVGTQEERTMCIEGAIERLADHDEQRARRACESLREEAVEVCYAAAKEKMYRLDKPSMPLYLP